MLCTQNIHIAYAVCRKLISVGYDAVWEEAARVGMADNYSDVQNRMEMVRILIRVPTTDITS